jgi:hypothetical protein
MALIRKVELPMNSFNKEDTPRTRLEKVESIDDDQMLSQIACTDDSPRVRLVAVSQIVDDEILEKIVKEANELDVRLVAVERITSEQKIAEIAKSPKNLDLLGMCFSRITDKKLIESIAEDTQSSPMARRMAIEQFADESYLAEAYEAKTGRKSEKAVEAFLEYYGGGLRGVRAIGRFKRSVKALKALGTIAQMGGEEGGLAVEYLCNALGSSNQKLATTAKDELSGIKDPALIQTLVLALSDSKFSEPIREVLGRIDSPHARAALGVSSTKSNS